MPTESVRPVQLSLQWAGNQVCALSHSVGKRHGMQGIRCVDLAVVMLLSDLFQENEGVEG